MKCQAGNCTSRSQVKNTVLGWLCRLCRQFYAGDIAAIKAQR
jgi:hypothetical protein